MIFAQVGRMNVLSIICFAKSRLARAVVAGLVALALVCAPLYTAIGGTTGPFDPTTKLTKLALDIDDSDDVCLYCGARCHCQQPTMDGSQSSIAEPHLPSSAIVLNFQPTPRPVLNGPPERPPKA